MREVGVVGVGGVASIWSETWTAENPRRRRSMSLGAIAVLIRDGIVSRRNWCRVSVRRNASWRSVQHSVDKN